jgi:hypothetical protein
MKLIQGFDQGNGRQELALHMDLYLCLCSGEHRLSSALLELPLACLEEVARCPSRAPSECQKAAVQALARAWLDDVAESSDPAPLAKLLLVATWTGISVPAVAKWLMTRTLEYAELKALGAGLGQGVSGPSMDLLQVRCTHMEKHSQRTGDLA